MIKKWKKLQYRQYQDIKPIDIIAYYRKEDGNIILDEISFKSYEHKANIVDYLTQSNIDEIISFLEKLEYHAELRTDRTLIDKEKITSGIDTIFEKLTSGVCGLFNKMIWVNFLVVFFVVFVLGKASTCLF